MQKFTTLAILNDPIKPRQAAEQVLLVHVDHHAGGARHRAVPVFNGIHDGLCKVHFLQLQKRKQRCGLKPSSLVAPVMIVGTHVRRIPDSPVRQARMMENILLAACEGDRTASGMYAQLRGMLMNDTALKPLLPEFVRACRDLNHFWSYAKELPTDTSHIGRSVVGMFVTV